MRTFRSCFLLTALAMSFGSPTSAALNPAIVPADAQWVVHVDFSALRGTTLGEHVLRLLPPLALTADKDPLKPNFAKIMETVGTATAFGSDLSGKPEAIDGAMVLQGTADLRKIAEGMVAQLALTQPEDAVEIKDLPCEAYVISREVFVAFPAEPIVLVSKSRAQLLKALEVYRKQAPSLAQADAPLARLLPRGGPYYLLGASVVPNAQQLFSGTGPQARILQLAESGSVALGEEGEAAVARLRLVSSSADTATKLVKIVEGITAMLSLAETNDERLTAFVRAMQVERQDRVVNLGFSYPTARLLEMVENMTKRTSASGAAPHHETLDTEGELIAHWRADQSTTGDAPAAHHLRSHEIADLELAPGTMLILTGRRDRGEHARWDYVELTPRADGGTAQRFEAEYMRLQGYAIEAMPSASGGEVIKAEEQGTARFRFNGPTGRYRVTLAYVDEADGASPLALSVVRPEGSAR